MNKVTSDVLQQTIEVLKTWDSVDTITLQPVETDIYDPYFFLSIDVFISGPIPNAEIRTEAFSFAGGFETAGINRKDRFLVGDIPVRLEYKEIDRFEALLEDSRSSAASVRETGTYVFYRLFECELLFSRSAWLDDARSRLDSMPDAFWTDARSSAEARMEHYLADLGAAVIQNDSLFYLVSASGFVTSACGTLFAINRKFEPSPRHLMEKSRQLEIVPDVFDGLLESFLRFQDTSLSRKREVAEMLAKKIIQI